MICKTQDDHDNRKGTVDKGLKCMGYSQAEPAGTNLRRTC